MIDIFFGENAIWFSAVALAGTGIFALRLLLMLIGVGDVDGGDVELAAEGDPSLGFLSLNGMAGIMMGFGYGALISYRSLEFGFVASIGIGVVLAETRKAAESVIEAFMGLKADILVQEFIKEAGGADIRCFVIGDKVIAAMKRQGAEGEFRSNLHRGVRCGRT